MAITGTFLASLRRMTPHMVDLIGIDAWQKIDKDFNSHLQQLNTTQDDVTAMRAIIALQKLIASYPHARERLALEVMLQEIFEQIRPEISLVINDTQVDKLLDLVSPSFSWGSASEDFNFRDITLSTIPELRATSVKARNVRFDPGQMLEVAATTALNVVGIAATLNPILVGFCTLLTLRALKKAMTIELSQNEASVFLGFVYALNDNPKANEESIFDKTNEVRQRFNLATLTATQFNSLIRRLEEMGSIEIIEGIWRVVEDYTIQN